LEMYPFSARSGLKGARVDSLRRVEQRFVERRHLLDAVEQRLRNADDPIYHVQDLRSKPAGSTHSAYRQQIILTQERHTVERFSPSEANREQTREKGIGVRRVEDDEVIRPRVLQQEERNNGDIAQIRVSDRGRPHTEP